jgi:hypothetical protein
VSGPVVEWAEIAQPFQSPSDVVAGDEVGDRSFDLGGGAEGSAPDRLLLERSEEPLNDAVALRLVREGVAQRHAPVADLVREVVGCVLRPVVQAQRHAAGGIGRDPAEPGGDWMAASRLVSSTGGLGPRGLAGAALAGWRAR